MRRIAVTALAAALLAGAALADDGGWHRYQDRDGIVSYSRALPDSRILATRGVTEADVHISRLLGVYLDVTRATQWVDLLVKIDELPIPDTRDAIERHLYDMPWPVADREFVFRRTVDWDEAARTVRVTYRSVDDARFPVTGDHVRATDHGSYFEFTALPDGRTRIEAVAMVDPMGSLPAWLFNSVQKSWPRNSIQALLAQAALPDVKVRQDCAGW